MEMENLNEKPLEISKVKNNKWVAKSTYVNEYHRNYYHETVEEVECEKCGSKVVNKFKISRHQKTKKCLKLTKEKEDKLKKQPCGKVCVAVLSISPSFWKTHSKFSDINNHFRETMLNLTFSGVNSFLQLQKLWDVMSDHVDDDDDFSIQDLFQVIEINKIVDKEDENTFYMEKEGEECSHITVCTYILQCTHCTRK